MNKTELLYDHYKETFVGIKENLNNRNRLFVIVFVVAAVQFLFATSPESISSLITAIIQKKYEIDISSQMSIIQSLLWIVLLYCTMRYYQTNVYVERQYNYIHTLERYIATIAQVKFDREGGDYLSHYPKMNSFVDILYKIVFPVIYCFIILYKIITEFSISGFGLLIAIDAVLCLSCIILTILYLIFLHCKK